MAKKEAPKKAATVKKPVAATKAPAQKKVITEDMIKIKAFEIYSASNGQGSPEEHWAAAEQALKK